jgi:hypothetical protein
VSDQQSLVASGEVEGRMLHLSKGLDAMGSLVRFGAAYQTMAIAAGEVILRRSVMIASGTMDAADAVVMVVEKVSTFAEAAAEATAAALDGHDVVAVAIAALEPYGTITASNVRSLRG